MAWRYLLTRAPVSSARMGLHSGGFSPGWLRAPVAGRSGGSCTLVAPYLSIRTSSDGTSFDEDEELMVDKKELVPVTERVWKATYWCFGFLPVKAEANVPSAKNFSIPALGGYIGKIVITDRNGQFLCRGDSGGRCGAPTPLGRKGKTNPN